MIYCGFTISKSEHMLYAKRFGVSPALISGKTLEELYAFIDAFLNNDTKELPHAKK